MPTLPDVVSTVASPGSVLAKSALALLPRRVRANTATALSGADNDYQPLITDTNGRLHVLDANSAAIAASLAIMDDWDEDHISLEALKLIGDCGFDALQVSGPDDEKHYRNLHRFLPNHDQPSNQTQKNFHLDELR